MSSKELPGNVPGRPGVQYGLIMPGKQSKPTTVPVVRKKPSIFNQSDSDSDVEGEDWIKKSLKTKASSNNTGLKKQTKIVMAKALEEDPTVFQYDEVYDKMEEKKEEEVEKKKTVDRQPKYIKNLLKSAEIRNKEFERRVERKVQKEREAEGEMFADKESFVTSAYRAKMEEMAKEEEEEERKSRIESALDVTKQKDLSGFYRHLYRQTHGEERSELEDKIKKEEEEKEELSVEEQARKVKEEMKKIKVESDEEKEEIKTDLNIKKVNKNKAFRKKKDEVSESSESGSSSGESEEEGENVEIKKEDLTAEEKIEKRKQEMKEQKERREKRKRKIEQDESSSEESEDEVELVEKKKKKKEDKTEKKKEGGEEEVEMVGQEKDEISKIDIWKKRTVGDVFEDALTRYWQRVADRRAN